MLRFVFPAVSILFLTIANCMVVPTMSAAQPAPVHIIFDTDMGNDIDDTLALAILHALISRREADLLAVTTTKDNPLVAPAVEVLNTFYQRPQIPVGVVKGGKTPEDSRMLSFPLSLRRSDGSPVYPHRLKSGADAPEAVSVLTKTLASQSDQSVTIVQVGFSTNLARLLESNAGLVKSKVKLLVIMAGDFSGGEPEYNVRVDLPAARKLFAEWPTPIVCSGFEVGKEVLYPATSIEHDFRYVEHHPVADAYRAFDKMPYDRPTWDLTAALYAVRPEPAYFSLSEPGRIEVGEKGKTTFTASPSGTHRYLIVSPEKRTRLVEAFRELASQPPLSYQPRTTN